MGNQNSSNAGAIQELWKTQRAILAIPITSNLEALSVLANNNNGSYRHIGNVISLSKPGKGQEWLKQKFARSKQKQVLPTNCISKQTVTISPGEQATIIANRLLGASNSNSSSMEVSIPECWVRALPSPDWDEVISNFTPKSSIPRELFIVQKVVLAPEIRIVDRSTGNVVVIRENRMLPIGFSGRKYSFDKFGNRAGYSSSSQVQHDLAPGARSSHSEEDAEEEEEGEEEEDDSPADDFDMGGFLEYEELLANIDDVQTQTELKIYDPVEGDDYVVPAGPPPSPPGSPPGSPLDDID